MGEQGLWSSCRARQFLALRRPEDPPLGWQRQERRCRWKLHHRVPYCPVAPLVLESSPLFHSSATNGQARL